MRVLKYAWIILLGVLFMVALVITCGWVESKDVKYNREGIVYSVDSDIVTIKDTTGNMWLWEVEDDSLSIGSCVKMHMSNNGTEDIEDDIILSLSIID